jgi:hypothetical protein
MCQSSLHVIIKCQSDARRSVTPAIRTMVLFHAAVCAPLGSHRWILHRCRFQPLEQNSCRERVHCSERSSKKILRHAQEIALSAAAEIRHRTLIHKSLCARLRRAGGWPKWPPKQRPFPHTPTRSASACCVQSVFLACCCCYQRIFRVRVSSGRFVASAAAVLRQMRSQIHRS